MSWILILTLFYTGQPPASVSAVPIPFASKDACKSAGEEWKRDMSIFTQRVATATCVRTFQ